MMIKQRVSRIIATILSLCIFTGDLPTQIVTATDEAVDVSYTYTFHDNGANDWGWYDTPANAREFTTDRNWRFYDYSSSAAAWQTKAEGDLFGDSTGNEYNTSRVIKVGKVYGLENTLTDTDQWIAVELKIPQDGVYTLSGTGRKATNCGKVDIYLFKTPDASMEIETMLDTLAPLGREDFYRTSASDTEVLFGGFDGALIPEAGNYLFIVKGAGKNESASGYLSYIPTLTLTRTGDVPDVNLIAKLGADKEEINEGDTIQTVLNVTDGVGTPITEGCSVEYCSSDSDIAEVSDTGLVTTKSGGTVGITAKVTYGEDSAEAVFYLKVLPPTVDLNFVLSGWYNKLTSYNDYDTGRAWRFYGYSTSAAAWEQLGVDDIFGSAAGGTDKLINVTPNSGITMNLKNADEWVAFEITLPKAGVYKASGMVSKTAIGGSADIYFIKAPELASDASYEAKAVAVSPLIDENGLAGRENYASTAGRWDPAYEMDCLRGNVIVAPEAGKYLLVVKGTGQDAEGKSTSYMGTLNLVRTGDVPGLTVRFSPESTDINEGETVSTSLTVINKYNKPVYEGYSVSYESSDISVAEINTSGFISAKAAGNATITATVTYGDEVKEASFDINVVLPPPTYNFVIPGWYNKLTAITEYASDRNWRFYGYSVSAEDWSELGTDDIFGSGAGGTGRLVDVSPTMGIAMNLLKRDQWVAIELHFPKSGTFEMSGMVSKTATGGSGDIYLFPSPELPEGADYTEKEAAINALLNDDNYIGMETYASTAGNWTPEYEMEAIAENNFIAPKAGNYVLVIKGTGLDQEGKSNSYLGNIRVKQVNSVELSADKTELELCDDPQKNSTSTSFNVIMVDGTQVEIEKTKILYMTSDEKVATVSDEGVVTATGEGSAFISMNFIYEGKTLKGRVRITVKDKSEPLGAKLIPPEKVYVRGKGQLGFNISMASGKVISTLGADDVATFEVVEVSPEGAATVDENGMITGIGKGTITVKACLKFRGVEFNDIATVTVEISDSSKNEPTLWTYEERESMRHNALYDSETKKMARSSKTAGDKWVENVDRLYDFIVAEGLPRYYRVGGEFDVKSTTCRYCGTDFQATSGNYGWKVDWENSPWKVQCSTCRRKFPSNDFGSYYKMGLDERGVFKRELAEVNHIREFGGLIGYGYLKNNDYPEAAAKFGDPDWAVDDGFGYHQKYTDDVNSPGYSSTYYEKDGKAWFKNTDGSIDEPIRHTYIAYFLHEGIWRGAASSSLYSLRNAYLYTGDVKYARAGAIILDRIADFYADYDWSLWYEYRQSQWGWDGAIMDAIWGSGYAATLAECYDIFYPEYEDEQLINYLNKKSLKYVMSPKDSAAALRKNVEDGILKEIYQQARRGQLNGNFGTHQNAVVRAAVALNTMPETGEMIDWTMAPLIVEKAEVKDENTPGTGYIYSGGNVINQLLSVTCRDGMGNEAAGGYNGMWVSYCGNMADALAGYELYPAADIYKNPKYIKMVSAFEKLIMGGYYSAQIGDDGAFADNTNGSILGISTLIPVFRNTKDVRIAQLIYRMNGNSVEGLRYADTVMDPTSLEDEIAQIIDTYGEIEFESSFQSGYGLYALRDGRSYPISDTSRDFWMYTGTTQGAGHGHGDSLNLGISAYGLNLAPELGYPEETGLTPNRMQWNAATISHNTVTVNEKTQKTHDTRGTPVHFDDAGTVKVMDAEKTDAYDETEEYRRTVVMVEVDDTVSYGVDFFRVKGGNDHLYSFHSQSKELSKTEGLELEPQSGITYAGKFAGKDVPYGEDPMLAGGTWNQNNLTYPCGYTWLKNVESDHTPAAQFAVDFKIEDFWKKLKDSSDMHLRMTMLNDFALDEVSVVDGYTMRTSSNPQTNIKYVLARRKGEDGLDTLFTTIFEPYKGNRYLKGMQAVPITYANGEAVEQGEVVKAVKVIHTDKRVDYIVYAADNTVCYKVDGLFDFKGFVGVISYMDVDGDGIISLETAEQNIVSTYLHDGEIIANNRDNLDAYTGNVSDFTKELSLDSKIIVKLDQTNVDVSALADKTVYIENDGVQNGGYRIKEAVLLENGDVELDIDGVSLIRGYANIKDTSKGFVYNIDKGQILRIPLTYMLDTAPVMSPDSGKFYASTGSELSFTVSATSGAGRELRYEAVILPRGAMFDEKTATFKWNPDSTQIGDYNVAIKVTDGVLSDMYNAIIAVHKSVTGSAGADGKPGDGSSGGNSGADNVIDGGNSGADNVIDGGNQQTTTPGGDEAETEQFIDLGNHNWAKEAIYGLVEMGIVKGTSERTYSPANNIKRADFAIMLTRAFKVTAGDAEQFADVDSSKYYAEELRLAKSAGIVAGVGENKFNPDGEISRQDMMLMLYRALKAQDYELSEPDHAVLADFSDAALISDYAKDAVAVLAADEIIAGANGKINPKTQATRAEIAVMLDRVIKE